MRYGVFFAKNAKKSQKEKVFMIIHWEIKKKVYLCL